MKAIAGNLFQKSVNEVLRMKKLLRENMKNNITKWPWLGCSPDTVVSNSRAIEIKFPLSKNNIFLTEACDDKKFS